MTNFKQGSEAVSPAQAPGIDAEPMISIRDFNLWYDDFQALKNITLDIPKNRATAFIGPSGCGKSTLLRTFNRMCDFVPTVRCEGSIKLAGTDIFAGDANALRVRVGMVFQHPNPFPMSIRDNILYGPRRMGKLGRSEADELVERCLTDAGLFDEVKDKLGQSGLGLGGQSARNAQALLLAAGKAQGALFQAVFHLVPEGGAPQGAFHQLIQLRLIADAVELGAVSNIVVDAHGEGVRLLEDHADRAAQFVHIRRRVVDVGALVGHGAGDFHAVNQIVHPVERFQKRGFAAARRTDERGDAFFGNVEDRKSVV